MAQGFKKAEGVTRPPDELKDLPKPEAPAGPEAAIEQATSPEQLGELLDKQAQDVQARLDIIRAQRDGGVIGQEKYLELKEELDMQSVAFVRALERAEKRFAAGIPPAPPEPLVQQLKKALFTAQYVILGKFEVAKELKAQVDAGKASEEELLAAVRGVKAAEAARDALVDAMPEETKEWARSIIELGNRISPEATAVVPGAETLAPVPEAGPEPTKEEERPFENVQSFQELEVLLRARSYLGKPRKTEMGEKLPPLRYAGVGDFSLDDILGNITDVRDGVSPLNTITREGGLRDKVRELLEKEQAAKMEEGKAKFEYKRNDRVSYNGQDDWKVEDAGDKLASIFRIVKNAKGYDTLDRRIVNVDELAPATGPEAPKPVLPGDVELEKPSAGPDVIGEVPLKTETGPQRPESEMMLDEVEEKHRLARAGGNILDAAYWQQRKDELAERTKATAGRPWGAGFMGAVKTRYEAVRTKTSSVAERIGGKVKKALPKFAERILTSYTFGWWDFHQAEKFRSATGRTARELQQVAETIRQEDGRLSQDEALREAQEMQRLMEVSGLAAEGGLTAADYDAAQLIVSERKRVENLKKEDAMVGYALDRLKQKLETSSWFMKYRDTKTGQSVLSPENLKELETRIRQRVRGLREGREVADLKDYKYAIRQSLDPAYWQRYVYGGIATALNAVGLAYVAPKLAQWVYGAEAAKTAAVSGAESAAGAAGAAGTEAAKQAAETALKDTIWQEAQRQLVQQGVKEPTNAMIQQVASEIAQESGVKVVSKAGQVIWQETAQGQFIDRALQKGFMLKLGAGLKKIAEIKASLG